ncbi:hypothetical protein HanIR_Chr12g0588251 [Helianthus annuus]|nr:hypothetical protein HanIR_Chr12g0588251 [Helianthus annuus]
MCKEFEVLSVKVIKYHEGLMCICSKIMRTAIICEHCWRTWI